MRNRKRTEMSERGCTYCKYYDRWNCKLPRCYMDFEAKATEEMEGAQAAEEQAQENELDCITCAYKKQGGCSGYCMQKVLVECKNVWSKNRQ